LLLYEVATILDLCTLTIRLSPIACCFYFICWFSDWGFPALELSTFLFQSV